MSDLTTIILTYNEELNIASCISSIKSISKRIIVIDSFSTDSTVDIASKLGAEIYQHEFTNQAKQFIYALNETNIKTNWVMRLDADERIMPETSEEMEQMMRVHNNDEVNGFIFKTRIFFMGRWIKHGGIYPLKIFRLFKYGKATVENKKMDEHLILLEGTILELNNDLLHYDFKSLSNWTDKHNKYATREMEEHLDNLKVLERSKPTNMQAKLKRFIKFNIYYKIPLFIRPFLYFFYRYFIRLGFLDGKEGLVFHFLQAYWYRFLVDAKIYENELKKKDKINGK